jgi:F420-dependent oxidoreductase-like protein
MSDADNRLGLALAPSGRLPIDDFLDLARLADELGYDSIWVPETWGYDAVSLLAALALRTKRVRIAAGIFNIFSRSAALLAQTAATLQDLSGGRFILGLGTSGPIVVENWHGVPYRHPLGRTRDYVEIIRAALDGRPVEYASERMAVSGFTMTQKPSVPVPLFIAALGPRNVRLTGEIADGWLPIFAVRGHMAPLFEQLHAGAEAAGRNPESIEVAAYIPAAIGDEGERRLRQVLAYYVGGMGTYYLDFVRRLGLSDAANQIREAWERGDRVAAASAVTPEMLDLCTLGTNPSAARERLSQYRAEGVSLPVLSLTHSSGRAELERTIRELAPSE